jgi:pimeloyl-ACP methyl ester carboxylesterase
MKRRVVRWVKIIALIYVIVGLALYLIQDRLLFHPILVAKNKSYGFRFPYREMTLPYDHETRLNIIRFLTADSSKTKGVVLYFHGNAKNIAWYANYSIHFTRNQYEVWMIDYPGFGKSTGLFTEDRLYDYALQLYRLARTKWEPKDIVIYGKSMGTGMATQLASVRDCRYLILETPYANLPSLVSHFLPIYPVSSFLHYRFPNDEFLKEVSAPVIILHGTKDRLIPISNARKLSPILKSGDEFISIDGASHNDLAHFPVFQRTLDSLLSR